jgi:hypothetical protein
VQEEFEQRYDATGNDPTKVWVFCRLCRCRIQVRTVPRPTLPIRCFCGYSGTLAKFDAFADEEEARRFATTFEDLYQTTKALLKEAEMPMPATRVYRPGDLQRALEKDSGSSGDDDVTREAQLAANEDEATYRTRARSLTEAVGRTQEPIARHEALSRLGAFYFARRSARNDARRLCHQACGADAQTAALVVREAGVRMRRGEKIRLHFPSFRVLVTLHEEEGAIERALDTATRAAALGLTGYDETVSRLRALAGPR